MNKIIIVGSTKTTLERKRNALSRSEFKIFTTTSAEEAIAIHKKEKVDLIISELELLGMAGDELCSIIRKDRKLKAVAIMLICYMKDEAISRCRACGANAYITKPLDIDKLSEQVMALLKAPARKGLRILTSLTIKGKEESDTFYAKSEDISSTGILLRTDRDLKKGGKVACSFFISSQQIIADGEIIRVGTKEGDMNRYGIKFLDITPEVRKMIDEYVKERLSQYS
jgi:DNA-binding response OmpR family regulator